MGNWFSTDWEIRVGKQYSMEIEKSAHLVTDPVIVEYVNRIGQNLVKNSDAKVPFTIKVIDSDEINAMALPGGFFYVNSGLIMNCDEEAELAGVMAHEISHVVAHHAARQQTKGMYAQIASIPLIIMTQGSWTGYGIYEASQLAIPLTFLKFSRMDEAEADYLGVQYMYKAGYDPQSFVTLFEKLRRRSRSTSPAPSPRPSPTTPRHPIASPTPRTKSPPSCRPSPSTSSPPASSTTSRLASPGSKTSARSTTRRTAPSPPCAAPEPTTQRPTTPGSTGDGEPNPRPPQELASRMLAVA